TLSCRNEGYWGSGGICNHSWHRSLHNYLSCCFRQVVLSREWSLSGRHLGCLFGICHPCCLGACSCKCGVSLCRVPDLGEPSARLSPPLCVDLRGPTLYWHGL